MTKYRKHAEVEAIAQDYLRRLGLRLSSWEPVIYHRKNAEGKTITFYKKDSKRSTSKTNRHRGHRNKQTGSSGKKGGK